MTVTTTKTWIFFLFKARSIRDEDDSKKDGNYNFQNRKMVEDTPVHGTWVSEEERNEKEVNELNDSIQNVSSDKRSGVPL